MNKVKGFSLIELVVALALGMLVTLAAVQLFMTNQSTFNVQRSSVEIMANGRLAMDVMTQAVRRAGYEGPTPPGGATSGVNVVTARTSFAPIPTASTDGTQLSGNDVTDGSTVNGVGYSDQLVVQYQAAQVPEVDCEGTSISSTEALITERYFLMQDTDNVPALGCDGVDADEVGTALARGVENLQVLLGIDTSEDDKKRASQYLSTTAYAALAAPRPPIVAVRIGMLVRGEQASPDTPARQSDFYVLQTRIQASSLPTDRRLRRVVVSTVELHNADRMGV